MAMSATSLPPDETSLHSSSAGGMAMSVTCLSPPLMDGTSIHSSSAGGMAMGATSLPPPPMDGTSLHSSSAGGMAMGAISLPPPPMAEGCLTISGLVDPPIPSHSPKRKSFESRGCCPPQRYCPLVS